MEVNVAQATPEQVIFGVRNVDVSFANALRRIMLAEVPTMAIAYVNIEENDSVMHDEVLAHRLGLIPIRADPIDYEPCPGPGEFQPGINCIEITLDYTAKKQGAKPDGSVSLLSRQFRAAAVRDERMTTASSDDDDGDDGNFMVHQDIVITKLAPTQRMKLRCFATRGIGADHIKWSPVSTAAYRGSPSVVIEKRIKGNDAEALKKICPKNVFDIEDGELVVADAGSCSVCRECVRDVRGKDRITLGRVPNSFDFSVETVGAISPEEIVRRATRVLREKCTNLLENLE